MGGGASRRPPRKNQTMTILLILTSLVSSFVPNRLIVKFKPSYSVTVKSTLRGDWVNGAWTLKGTSTGIPEVDRILEANSLLEIRRLILGKQIEKDATAKQIGLDRYFLLIFKGEIDHKKLIEDLTATGAFEVVEPDEMRPVSRIPNDPRYGPDYWTQTWFLPHISAPRAWDITTGSRSIVVGPVDTGVDWHHEDIFDNLWVNPGEDLNHNGVFDYPDDLNGVDDDGDGYVDDIIGFDFFRHDWDPYPEEQGNDHGTHVFGLATGVTDNATGIASISWNTKGMAFKCGDGQYIYTSAAINAIYFAVSHGAVATSHSYGGYYYRRSEADAIAYAHQNNVAVFAAAGNDSSSSPHYPSAYPYVIGVASTDMRDRKSSFSNYGWWVDVCAPGENILSTTPGNSYAAFDGTSMATPIVCGLAGLLKSLHPDFTVEEVDSAILWGADDIYGVNPDSLRGKLGWGRINAFKTLALTVFPGIKIGSLVYSHRPDTGGVLNSISVDFVYNEVHWQNASNVTLIFTSPDTSIIFEDSTIYVGNINSGDTVFVTGDSVTFRAYGEPGYVPILVYINSTPQNPFAVDTFQLIVGRPGILLINDDVDDSRLSYYTGVISASGLNFEVASPNIQPEDLLDRELVIWYTGNNETPDTNLISAVSGYLDGGGNLFVSSQFMAENAAFSDFITNYLKANVVQTGRNYRGIKEVVENPWTGSFYRLYGAGSAANNISGDIIEPVGGDTVVYYTSPAGTGNFGVAGVGYTGSYISLFFAFPFESVSEASNGRTNLFLKILSYFGIRTGIEEHTRLNSGLLTNSVVLNDLIFNKRLTGEVKIYDVTGALKMKVVLKNKKTVNLGELGSGVYFLRVKEGGGELFKGKILKIQGRR